MPKDPIKTLEKIERQLDKNVCQVLNIHAFEIRTRVTSQEFLHWKTRRRPIVVTKASAEKGGVAIAYVRAASRWKYANVHIGRPGTTTIRPQRGKFLALPTDAAQKTIRTRKIGPKAYGGTFIAGGVIWGKVGWKGTRSYVRNRRAAGQTMKKNDLVPLFILKGSVVVRRRIIPEYLINWIKPRVLASLRARALKTI